MAITYTKQDLRALFFVALDQFNECLGSDISEQNTQLAFFLPENGVEVYEQFCGEFFPSYLEENYKDPGYFEPIAAQAFVSDDRYGVLIREDLELLQPELIYIFLHEISHLFCTNNEITKGRFFDTYCMGNVIEDGMINAGYAIWREAIADIMADSVMSEYALQSLADFKKEIRRLDSLIKSTNPDSKKCMSLIIAYAMIAKEVSSTTDWIYAEKAIRKAKIFHDEIMYDILQMVFNNLHIEPFWSITPEFIADLGSAYLMLLSLRAVSLGDRIFRSDEQGGGGPL